MRRQRPALVVLGAVAFLAACGSGPVRLDSPSPSPSGADAAACERFVDALPDRVGDQDRRDVEGLYGAAYGDPAIVILCGVPRPDELIASCMTVNGVDWYAPDDEVEDTSQDVVAITVGREPNIEMRAPARYRPLDAEFVDVAGAVKQTTKRVSPCL